MFAELYGYFPYKLFTELICWKKHCFFQVFCCLVIRNDAIKTKKLIDNIIRGFTLNAAYSMNIDDVTGSLEVGKFADFMILNQNIFENGCRNIYKTKVLKTYLKGNVVYENR